MNFPEKKIKAYTTMLKYLLKHPEEIMAGNYMVLKVGENIKPQKNFLPIDTKLETKQTIAVYSFGMSILNTSTNGRIQEMKYDQLATIMKGEVSQNLFEDMNRIEASLVEQCIFKDPLRRIKLPNISKHPLFCKEDVYPFVQTKISAMNPTFNRDHKINSSIEINRGGYGVVYLVLKTPKSQNWQHLKYYIKKKVSIESQAIASKLKEEAKINQYLIDHYVAGCILPFDEKITDKCVKLYMEYYPSVELGVLIDKYGCVHENDVRLIFEPVIKALKQLNDLRIIYRDVKPANILVGVNKKTQQIEGKLIDFGIAKTVTDPNKNSLRLGTPSFMAPEVLSKTDYTYNCDIYSIGVSIYNSLIGKHPLLKSASMIESDYIADMPPIKTERGLSVAVIDLMQRCMQFDPHMRLQKMDDLLGHPFFDSSSDESKTKQKTSVILSTTKIISIDKL